MPLMSSLLYLLHSVEGQLQVSYISLPEGKIIFFPPEIRYQKPYEIVFTVSVSNRLDHLSTAAGCYMHRHTFSCCKLLCTCIFSGFQKQFLGAERQYWICCWQENQVWLELNVKAGSYVHSSRADPYSVMYVLLTTLEQTAHISPSPAPELLLSPGSFPWLCRYELLRPGPLCGYNGKWCRMHICTEEQTLFPTQHKLGNDGSTP